MPRHRISGRKRHKERNEFDYKNVKSLWDSALEGICHVRVTDLKTFRRQNNRHNFNNYRQFG
jgi:hypothetical protein